MWQFDYAPQTGSPHRGAVRDIPIAKGAVWFHRRNFLNLSRLVTRGGERRRRLWRVRNKTAE
jgi:hypothetical protein